MSAGRPRVVVDARKLFDGGIGRYLRELLRRLPALLGDVELIALVAPGAEAGLVTHGLDGLAIRWEVEHARKYGLREGALLRRRVRALGASLFHAPHYVLPGRLPCPSLVTVHDAIHLDRPRSPLHLAYARLVMGRACRGATYVLTVSETTAAGLERRFRIGAGRLVVVPNGVAPPDPASRVPFVEPGYVLYLGSLKPHKNVALLVRAYARIAARVQAPLHVHGQWIREERHRAALADEIERLGVTGRVHLLGEVPEPCLGALFDRARVLVAPALDEGFGLPPLEALARGVPVIASRRGAYPEVLGDAARYVAGDDDAELARVLLEELGEGHGRERAAAAGPRRAARFTWERTAEETARVYRSALASAPRGRP